MYFSSPKIETLLNLLDFLLELLLRKLLSSHSYSRDLVVVVEVFLLLEVLRRNMCCKSRIYELTGIKKMFIDIVSNPKPLSSSFLNL